MKLYSTNNKENQVSLKQAVLKSLAVDKGLYMPMDIPTLSEGFIKNLNHYTMPEIAYAVCSNLFKDEIAPADLMQIVSTAINFPAPVVPITKNISTLELFHGPSLAFKDFGARFMAQLMSYFTRDENDELTILVATSGDTGGAVAAGFYDTPGINVIILYPSGKVSEIQEKQLTTLGKNISACEIDGNFDDCQRIVKTAFLDDDLNKKYNLSSANSINIARLIPQSFYYFEAFKQRQTDNPLAFCIPSGNFGNLTVVPDYLASGNYEPVLSKQTIANAMDVGSPSNFTRMQQLYPSVDAMRKHIAGYWYNDETIKQKMKEVYTNTSYVMDPHGAIGYLASEKYLESNKDHEVIFFETAHPCKFKDDVESAINDNIEIPSSIRDILTKEKQSTKLDSSFDSFKAHLLG